MAPARLLLLCSLALAPAGACGSAPDATTPATAADQRAYEGADTGRFEIVRERATADGGLELRVRAENLDAAPVIARKLADVKKATSRRVAVVEFIGMKDQEDGPSRRTVQNP